MKVSRGQNENKVRISQGPIQITVKVDQVCWPSYYCMSFRSYVSFFTFNCLKYPDLSIIMGCNILCLTMWRLHLAFVNCYIMLASCERWVHKKCSGIKGRLLHENEFTCAPCLGTARAIDGRQTLEVEVGNEKLEVVPEFCYLGDMLSAGGGCELAAITRCKCAWDKFRQLLPLLTNRQVPLLTRGKVYSSCVRSVMLHAAETWAMKADTLNRLRRNDRAMIRWICNVKAKDEVSSDSLLPGLRCGAPHR